MYGYIFYQLKINGTQDILFINLTTNTLNTSLDKTKCTIKKIHY